MAVRKTAIRIDDDLVALAREALGTATMTETVNGALQEVVDRRRVQGLIRRIKAGGLDLEVIEDAWH